MDTHNIHTGRLHTTGKEVFYYYFRRVRVRVRIHVHTHVEQPAINASTSQTEHAQFMSTIFLYTTVDVSLVH